MNRATNEYFDIICIIFIMCMALFNLPPLASYWGKSLVAYREDKTALDVNEAISVPDADLTSDTYVNSYGNTMKKGKDLILALLVADEGTSFPKQIKLGSSDIVKIDDAWLSNRYGNLANMKVNNTTRLVDIPNANITRVELLYSGTNAFWYFEFA